MEKNQSDEGKISKIKTIIEREIGKEIINKQNEVTEISEKIEKALRHLEILKYVVSLNYYENNLESKKVSGPEEEYQDDKLQTQLHPCIKKLLPFRSNYAKSFGDLSKIYETRKTKKNDSATGTSIDVAKESNSNTENVEQKIDVLENNVSNQDSNSNKTYTNTQLPKYIPPLPNPDIVKETVNSQRGGISKVQHRIIIGNISKWIPPDMREDNSTHKWMVYIRNQNKDKDITQLIRKVRYFLHESYKPHDIIDVTSPPFYLTRRGWGEFPVRVQLHFHHFLNKPVDIVHHLKLDMTYSGVQTLGAETVVELCLHQNNLSLETAQPPVKKIIQENDCENGKKRVDQSDIFDGNLLLTMNGIKNDRVDGFSYIKNEEKTDCIVEEESVIYDGIVPEPECLNSVLITKNSNLMLDRRKLIEIINREHDYIKNEHSFSNSADDKSLDSGQNSVLKLIQNCENKSRNNENLVVFKNGKTFETIKLSLNFSKKIQNMSKMEVDLCKSEKEIFNNLKTMMSKLGGENESSYTMKLFGNSYMLNIRQRVLATKLTTSEALIRWFCRRWPIVTELALDPLYKCIHPYSCATEEEFLQFNIGKQRSAEWFRARAIQKILFSLKPIIPLNEDIWTTKQILMWSRFHGYSPISFAKTSEEDSGESFHRNECNKRLKSNDSSSDSGCDSSDCTLKKGKVNGGKFANGLNLADRRRNFKKGRKKNLPDDSLSSQPKNYLDVNTYTESNDINRYGSFEYRLLQCENSPEIDVVTLDENVKSGSGSSSNAETRLKREKSNVTIVTARYDEFQMNKFVCKAAKQIGIKLLNEEIVPGVMCDSAIRVMSQAALSFLDELLRKSFAQAWLRNGDRVPSSLEYNDILATLMENPQFDLFTNRGLGVQPAMKSEY